MEKSDLKITGVQVMFKSLIETFINDFGGSSEGIRVFRLRAG